MGSATNLSDSKANEIMEIAQYLAWYQKGKYCFVCTEAESWLAEKKPGGCILKDWKIADSTLGAH